MQTRNKIILFVLMQLGTFAEVYFDNSPELLYVFGIVGLIATLFLWADRGKRVGLFFFFNRVIFLFTLTVLFWFTFLILIAVSTPGPCDLSYILPFFSVFIVPPIAFWSTGWYVLLQLPPFDPERGKYKLLLEAKRQKRSYR